MNGAAKVLWVGYPPRVSFVSMASPTILSSLRLVNFKCFRDITIPFREANVLVGRNNAGKSTIVEALRLIALVRARCEHLRFSDPAYWTELHPRARGVSPSLEDLDLNFEALFHRYGEPPARIMATFSNGSQIEVLLGLENDRGAVHGVLRDKRRQPAMSSSGVGKLGLPALSILPQVAPLNKKEVILNAAYVQRSVSTSLAPNHFRNQINILPQHYTLFRKIAEESWPGLRVIEFRGRGGGSGDPLALLVQSDDFVAEVSWMGHGLQMWLQTMWFLARSKSSDIVMLDEPDVYMHPDLQRRLIRFLRDRFPQTIVTTHSVEILSEVSPQEILLIDKRRQRAGFADSVQALQIAVDKLGATQNLQLSRLWTARKLILLEGKDIEILPYLHFLIFPDSLESLASLPHLSIGGWGG
jgi:energy-coupling factor transporter ATP-binding protein EcfA2